MKAFLCLAMVMVMFVQATRKSGPETMAMASVSVTDDKPINKKCPVSGKDVDPKATSTYKNQVIGFCCMDCKAKFDKDPEKYIGKVKEFKKSSAVDISFADDKPINKKCPVSGKDVDPKATSTYKDQVIGFCCMDCKAKFDKDPTKYIGKVKEFKDKK